MSARQTWTEAMDAYLLEYRGKQSCRTIGEHLGVTRMAVAGRAHRLKLERISDNDPYQYRARTRPLRRKAKLVKERPRLAVVLASPPRNIPFADRERHECAFPTEGEGLAMLVCGNNVVEGRSYCLGHCSIAYEPPRERVHRYRTAA
jgi:hypothetical protein